jgi:glutathione S-transferase
LQIQGILSDLKAEVFKAAFNPEYKTALAAAAASGKVPNKIAALAKHLGEQHYAVGNHVTIADVFLAYHVYFIKHIYASADLECPFAAHANLIAAEAHFWALPQIAPHVASDAWKRPFLPPTMAPWLKF